MTEGNIHSLLANAGWGFFPFPQTDSYSHCSVFVQLRSGHSLTHCFNQTDSEIVMGHSRTKKKGILKKITVWAGLKSPFETCFSITSPWNRALVAIARAQSLWPTNLALALPSRSQSFLSAPSIARTFWMELILFLIFLLIHQCHSHRDRFPAGSGGAIPIPCLKTYISHHCLSSHYPGFESSIGFPLKFTKLSLSHDVAEASRPWLWFCPDNVQISSPTAGRTDRTQPNADPLLPAPQTRDPQN